jgi:hypothetical protein
VRTARTKDSGRRANPPHGRGGELLARGGIRGESSGSLARGEEEPVTADEAGPRDSETREGGGRARD